jgi:hypothetical protein
MTSQAIMAVAAAVAKLACYGASTRMMKIKMDC